MLIAIIFSFSTAFIIVPEILVSYIFNFITSRNFLIFFLYFLGDSLVIQEWIFQLLLSKYSLEFLFLELVHSGLIDTGDYLSFLVFARTCLCTKIWFILDRIPWAFEKTVYCEAVGWNILQMSVKLVWSLLFFNSEVSLLISFFFFWPGWLVFWRESGVEVSHYYCVGVYLCFCV
jgi:hypothetical protein